jgi:hypothetical protein
MGRLQVITAVWGLLLVVGSLGPIHARITEAIVTKDDRSLFPIASPFGFGLDGHIDLTVTGFQPWHHSGEGVPDPKLNRMGFFITASEAQTLLEFDLAQARPLPDFAAQ